MINFVSTFPPIMCGIGTYTKYLVSHMPPNSWRVTSFKLDEFFQFPEPFDFDDRVSYELSLKDPGLPSSLQGDVVWFQHAFGMWGRNSSYFLKFVEDAKKRGKKLVASFHTIHFQSPETHSGMQQEEMDLLKATLPLLDALTVFTKGAYQSVVKAFPEYGDKVVIIRHGVHLYPMVSRRKARVSLIEYLINQAKILPQKKRELEKNYSHLLSPRTIILGNFGFITADKAFTDLYRFRQLIQKRLPRHRIITFVIGKIQLRKDRKTSESSPLLEGLKFIHDGNGNLFFEDYIPERLLPLALRALDFTVFWPRNATQSGRMSHALGAGACVTGRKIEGIGETLRLCRLPAATTLEELAEVIEKLILCPELRKKAERLGREYARRYFYGVQAKKHLLLAESLMANKRLPVLDGIFPSPFRGEVG